MESNEKNKSQKPTILYQFKRHGYQVQSSLNYGSDNTSEEDGKIIYVDIGNDLRKGVIDHHHSKAYTSTVKALKEKGQDLIPDVKDQGQVIICTHTMPDSDAILATYIVKKIIESGDNSKDIKSDENLSNLIDYVDRIDAGLGKFFESDENGITFYGAICYLNRIARSFLIYEDSENKNYTQEQWNAYFDEKLKTKLNAIEQNTCDQEMIRIGHILIDKTLANIKKDDNAKSDSQPKHDEFKQKLNWSVLEFDNNPGYAIVKNYIKELSRKDKENYEKEKAHSITFEDIYVWTNEEKKQIKKVRAAIWREEPISEFSYLYARADDNALVTVIPLSIKEKHENNPYTHVIISVNPDGAPNITLRPLAEMLELLEQIEENDYFTTDGLWRRDHSWARKGFEDLPFGATADPWYCTPDNHLVESPRNDSILNYGTIITVLKRHTQLINKTYTHSCTLDGASVNKDVSAKRMHISEWLTHISTEIEKQSSENYTVMVTTVDRTMIMYRNEVIKALCMQAFGISDYNSRNILELDYNTCAYADEKVMVMLTATGTDDDEAPFSKGSRLLSSGKRMDDISYDVAKIGYIVFKQRIDLSRIGSDIHECVANSSKSRKLYDEYVTFLANEQSNGIMDSLVKQDIYDYLRTMLKIDSLKQSVQEALEIVTNDSMERQYSIFNGLASVTIPFVLISTLFQMGVLRLDAAFDGTSLSLPALGRWGIVGLIVLAICWFLYTRGKKK